MKPAELLVVLVECIKARATPRSREAMVIESEDTQGETTGGGDAGDDSDEEEGGEPAAETEDQILKDMREPYAEALAFLWTLHHRPSDLKPPTTGILCDPGSLAWDAEVDGVITSTAPQVTPVRARTSTPESGQEFGAVTAMTKLSEAMTRYQEAAAKAQEDKVDVRQKSWNRLPQIQRNIILLGEWMTTELYPLIRRKKCYPSWAARTEPRWIST